MSAKAKSKAKSFNPAKCAIPSVWCGESATLPRNTNFVRYTRAGAASECLKKGIGAGMAIQKQKTLPPTSLQQIKYVGDKHEGHFRTAGIRTTTELRRRASSLSPSQISTLLRPILSRSTGTLDGRAYNSVLMYLYSNGIGNLPNCITLN